jgi:hypothetical protein
VYAGDSTPQRYGIHVGKWRGLSASLALTFPPAALLETRANAIVNTTNVLITFLIVFSYRIAGIGPVSRPLFWNKAIFMPRHFAL